MDYDIIIYAVIAVLVAARLWSVLGQHGNEDHERPNPFAPPPSVRPDNARLAGQGDAQGNPVPLMLQAPQHAPDSLAGGLAQIKTADPLFDEKQFLQMARTAFTLILDDFAKGDLSSSTHVLSPAVLPHFTRAIEARHAAGETLDHKLIAIRDAECVAARLNDKRALVTVRFVSDQSSILRDAVGAIVDGMDGKTEEITDIWIFARDTTSTDPNWILTETRS